jgi:rubrerythrin
MTTPAAKTKSNPALPVLERAICMEQDGQAFYRQSADQTADPRGRRMFLDLAEAEALHEQIIRKQIDSLVESGQFADDERVDKVSCDLSLSLFPQGEARHKAMDRRAGEMDALWFAMQKENESYDLYRQGAQQATDPLARSLYQHLMAAEREHFEMLMANYEAILAKQHRPS